MSQDANLGGNYALTNWINKAADNKATFSVSSLGVFVFCLCFFFLFSEDKVGKSPYAQGKCGSRRRGAGLTRTAPAAMAPLRAGPLYTSDQKPLVPAALESPRTLSLPGDRAGAFDWAERSRPRYGEEQTGRIWFISGLTLRPSPQSGRTMETQTDRKVLAAVCPNQMGRRRRRAAVSAPPCL